jgi:hypothetical protein
MLVPAMMLLDLLSVTGAVPAQPAPRRSVDAPADLFAQARPHLEAVLGYRLEPLLNFQVVTPEKLKKLIAQYHPELAELIRWQFPDLQGEARNRAWQAACSSVFRTTAAMHVPGSRLIVVVPGNLAAISQWDSSLARINSPEFLQLAIVRETMRFLLDDKYHIAHLRKHCRDGDACQALQAVIEGRTLQVTENVARRLGTEEWFPLLTRCYLHVPEPAGDTDQQRVSYHIIKAMHWSGENGLAFFHYLEEHGIGNAPDIVFAEPPQQTGWITRPEFYVKARIAHRRDLATVLAQLPPFPVAGWKAFQQPWTAAMVCQVANLLGEKERAAKVLVGWDEARSLVWTSGSPSGGQVALSVVRFENPGAAQAYFGFAIDLQRKRDTLLGKGGTAGGVVEAHSGNVPLQGAEEAVRSDRRIQLSAETPTIPMTVLLARSGDLVFEWNWHGLPADMAWAQRCLDCFFAGQGAGKPVLRSGRR